MTSVFKNSATRWLAFFGMFGLLIIAGTSVSYAQIFQAISGGPGEDAARGGVLYETNSPLPDGFISVGESNSFGAGDYDIYVVRTDVNGFIIWAATYDLGGYDVGRKIARTSDSAFVITGMTEDKYNCCAHYNVFLLKIDAFGNPVWARTFGGEWSDEGRDIKVGIDPSGVEVIYIAGWCQSFAGSRVDGYLIKTDNTGTLQWARVYGEDYNPNTSGVDFFNSCYIAANGDVIVAGATGSYTPDYDIWIGRVDPFSGQGRFAHYGGQSTDIANSVIELQFAPFGGDIVVVGWTYSITGTQDAVLMRVGGNLVSPGPTNVEVVDAGFVAFNAEELFEVVETRPTPVSNMGTLMVCGRFYNNPTGLGSYDGYMDEYSPALNAPSLGKAAGGVQLYGGGGDEGLWGVAIGPPHGLGSPFYTAVGVGATSSFAFFGGFEDEYWVRADRQSGKSGCNEAPATMNEFYPYWPETFVNPCTKLIRIWCRAPIAYTYNFNMGFLCWSPSIHQGQDPTKGDNTYDPTSARDTRFGTAEIETPMARNETMTAIPNPVHKGENFDIRISRPSGTIVTVTVTDVLGNKVAERELTSRGDGLLTVPTEGWASGSYVVTVNDGKTSQTTKVIVQE